MAISDYLSLALSVAGTVTQARGAKKAGNAAGNAAIAVGEAQQRAANSEAGLSDYNAAVADLQATDAVQRAQQQEAKFRSGVRGLIGSQTASAAADNISVSSGSAVDVRADSAFLGELDALEIRVNGAREAWGYRVQAQDLRTRAGITRRAGADAAAAGRIAASGINSATNTGIVNTVLGEGASLLSAKYGFGGSPSGGGSSSASNSNTGVSTGDVGVPASLAPPIVASTPPPIVSPPYYE